MINTKKGVLSVCLYNCRSVV